MTFATNKDLSTEHTHFTKLKLALKDLDFQPYQDYFFLNLCKSNNSSTTLTALCENKKEIYWTLHSQNFVFHEFLIYSCLSYHG